MSTRIDFCAAGLALAFGWLPIQALATDELPIRVTTGADGVVFMTNLPEAITTRHAGAAESKPSARHASPKKTSETIMRIPVDHEPTVPDATSDGQQNGKSFRGDD